MQTLSGKKEVISIFRVLGEAIFKNVRMLIFITVAVASASSSYAFTPDEFNTNTLGTHWQYVPSPKAAPTTKTMTGTHLQLEAPLDSDHYFDIETQAYVQQDAPSGNNWEVVTKIDGWDPTQPGQTRRWTRIGMELWQDDENQVCLSLRSSFNGDEIDYQCFCQALPVDAPGYKSLYETEINSNNMGVAPDRFLKLKKTSKGYQGFISTDGVTWLQCLPIIRNPAPGSDGSFVNGKIRLFNTGGFDREVPTSGTPAKFDYIRVSSVTPPYAGHLDDEFNAGVLGPQWETYLGISPGIVGFNEGNLTLTAGPFAALWTHGQEQPLFVYQDAPEMSHYTSTIKAGPTQVIIPPDFMYELFNSYGIWLWRDQSNWILISNQRGARAGNGGVVDEGRVEALVKLAGQFESNYISFDSAPLPPYLRIENNNGFCKLLYSFDNTTWTTVTLGAFGSEINLGQDHLQLRLFNKRAFDSRDYMTANFDWLRSVSAASDVQDWQLY